MEKIKNWLTSAAFVLFDDTKNDLRALPKTVRLQILIVLSALWSTVFSIWVFAVPMFIYGWLGVFVAHILIIFVAYYTFKQFQYVKSARNLGTEGLSLAESPISKFGFTTVLLVFILSGVFYLGLQVMHTTKANKKIPYSGPELSTGERIQKYIDKGTIIDKNKK